MTISVCAELIVIRSRIAGRTGRRLQGKELGVAVTDIGHRNRLHVPTLAHARPPARRWRRCAVRVNAE